jgi:hypothetical protein
MGGAEEPGLCLMVSDRVDQERERTKKVLILNFHYQMIVTLS